jgi:rhamnosyltransferase
MSDNHPRVAVLLAAYNGMAWIEQQVASILAQTGVVVTIYISIDPSSDGTEAWCNEYAISHPTIRSAAIG